VLIAAGSAWDGAAAEGGALVAAIALTGCVAVTLAILGMTERSLRGFVTHPGPGLMVATAAMAWLGVAST
jgi:hypothetical protein